MNTLIEHNIINPQVSVVCGAKNGAIYDFENGSVYSINKYGLKILEKAFKNDVNLLEEEKRFLETLEDLGIINPIAFLKKKTDNCHDDLATRLKPDILWLELTQKCNLQCVHCYANGGKDKGSLTLAGWKKIIQDGAKINFKSIQFIGGEPLLFKGLRELISCAIKCEYEYIELFTNATLFEKNFIKWLRDKRVVVAFSIYSINPETHDRITKVKGSFVKTITWVKNLIENGIPVRPAVIAMKHNQDSVFKTVTCLKEIGFHIDSFEIVKPIGRGGSEEVLPDSDEIKKYSVFSYPNFCTNYSSFYKNKNYNSCWAGKILVCSNGDVLPCVMARDQVLGNIRCSSLEEIIHGGKTWELWGLSKDRIDTCKDCEYRYACMDCRPTAYAVTNNLYSKNPLCKYNPYTGLWENK